MRRIILPLIIIFLGSSFYSAAQTGANCNDPYLLDIGSGLTCANFPVSVTAGSPVLTGGAACGFPAAGRQTWFAFFSDGTCPKLSIDAPAGTRTEVVLYTGCPTPFVAAASICLPNGSGLWSPNMTFVNGDPYYIRVYTNATSGNIGICDVKTVAQEIALNGTCTNFDLSPTATNVAGNISSISPCGGTADRTVTWAKFHTGAANECVTLDINNTGTPTEVALYGNGTTCGNTVRAGSSVCFTDGVGVWSAGSSFPNNLYTPNTDYYLRVYSNIAPGTGGIISICGTERTQATNDLCTTAVGFEVTPPLPANNACAHYTAGTEGLTNTNNGQPSWICATTLQNTVWYKFKVTNGGTRASVSISGINCDSYNNSSTLLQMGLLTGTCGSLAPALPTPNSPPYPTTNGPGSPTSCLATMNASTVTLYTNTTVTSGQVVYLAIDGYSGANCKFNLQSINNITPIPIILKYFTAWKQPASNRIRWVTSSEHLNNYFEVERSLDGTNFTPIGRVLGHIESTTDQVYDLEDKTPPSIAYYRLKQVDLDEKFSYSEVIMLKRTENVFFNASMPNPVGNSARITISTEVAGMVALRIMDGAGRQVISENVACTRGNNIVNKDFSRLAAGNYFLLVTQDSKRVVKSFIKQ